jgi:hypothetical protein
MKLYITQDWLDELSGDGSPGNPGSGGNGCESVCANASPNSAAYKLCGCDGGGESAATIDQWIIYILVVIAVVAVIVMINRYLEHKRAKKIIESRNNFHSYNRRLRRKRNKQIIKDLNKKR